MKRHPSGYRGVIGDRPRACVPPVSAVCGAPAVLPARMARVPAYPVVLLLAFLVTELIAFWVPIWGLIRATVVLTVVAVLLQLALGAALGRHRGAYVAALVMVSAFEMRMGLLLLVGGLALLLYRTLQRGRPGAIGWPVFTIAANGIATLALVMSATNAVILGAGVRVSPPPVPVHAPEAAAEAPDIYLILLDMYPRADTLREALRFDNSPFLTELEAIGFDIAERSHSNYQRTILSLASILNGRHIADLVPDPPAGQGRQDQLLNSWISDAGAVNAAQALGYEFVFIPSEKTFVSPSTADRFVDSGQLKKHEFVMHRSGWLSLVAPDAQVAWLREQHRQRIVAAFDALGVLAGETRTTAKLVLAHVMAPHYPVVLARDGVLPNVLDCYWDDDCVLTQPLSPAVEDGLQEQVEVLNGLVLSAVREILAKSARPPAIVVFGDHGFRHWQSDDPETFRNLFVTFTPDHPGLFPDDSTLVNILPRVLNAYLDAGMPLATEQSWTDGTANGYFPFTPWSEG